MGRQSDDPAGALMTLAREPFGQALLIATAVGLAGYATWRSVRAGIGRGSEQNDSGFRRLAGVASGVAYAALRVPR
ncbi:MAG: DUF1206 domain-containing protein [Solirubrobacteraceae bacterium]